MGVAHIRSSSVETGRFCANSEGTGFPGQIDIWFHREGLASGSEDV